MPDTPLNPDALAQLIMWKELPFGGSPATYIRLDANAAHKVIELLRPHLAVAQPEVNSVEEAERLPHMSVILDSEGCAWQRNGHQNGWATWSALGDEFFTSAIEAFPARVLYRPEVNDA